MIISVKFVFQNESNVLQDGEQQMANDSSAVSSRTDTITRRYSMVSFACNFFWELL